jgi:hypothetical protein
MTIGSFFPNYHVPHIDNQILSSEKPKLATAYVKMRGVNKGWKTYFNDLFKQIFIKKFKIITYKEREDPSIDWVKKFFIARHIKRNKNPYELKPGTFLQLSDTAYPLKNLTIYLSTGTTWQRFVKKARYHSGFENLLNLYHFEKIRYTYSRQMSILKLMQLGASDLNELRNLHLRFHNISTELKHLENAVFQITPTFKIGHFVLEFLMHFIDEFVRLSIGSYFKSQIIKVEHPIILGETDECTVSLHNDPFVGDYNLPIVVNLKNDINDTFEKGFIARHWTDWSDRAKPVSVLNSRQLLQINKAQSKYMVPSIYSIYSYQKNSPASKKFLQVMVEMLDRDRLASTLEIDGEGLEFAGFRHLERGDSFAWNYHLKKGHELLETPYGLTRFYSGEDDSPIPAIVDWEEGQNPVTWEKILEKPLLSGSGSVLPKYWLG